MMQKIIAPEKVFTGTEWLQDKAIVIENEFIKEIISTEDASENVIHYPDQILVPAFIDAQVYGAANKLFSAFPTPDTLQVMHETFIKEGAFLFQPTMATNTLLAFKCGIDAIKKYWEMGGKGVHGIHLEGPWINKEKRGAHIEQWIHAATTEEVKELLEYGKGVITMITLAPEVCCREVIELIHSFGIIVSAGHSNATYSDAMNAFEKGISRVTHLYNAMSPLHHRAPGLVGAAFNHPTIMASIIPDGIHVDYAAVLTAKKIMGPRLFAITDAVTHTTMGPYQHSFANNKYECNGTLSGSAISMHKAFLNLVHHAKIEVDEALRMCTTYPAKALSCYGKYGTIAPGAAAQMIVLNNELQITDVITSRVV